MELRNLRYFRENSAFAQKQRFIVREERSFVSVVDGTFGIPAHALEGGA